MEFLLWLASAVIGFIALFFVVRAAVLSALREHHAEVVAEANPRPVSHLDADGL